jgi:hypothetical protein
MKKKLEYECKFFGFPSKYLVDESWTKSGKLNMKFREHGDDLILKENGDGKIVLLAKTLKAYPVRTIKLLFNYLEKNENGEINVIKVNRKKPNTTEWYEVGIVKSRELSLDIPPVSQSFKAAIMFKKYGDKIPEDRLNDSEMIELAMFQVTSQ